MSLPSCTTALAWRQHASDGELPALHKSQVGGGVDFPKSFEKFAGLARREKFPEICSDRHGMGTSDPLKMVSDPLKTT